jgi:hypothetical protein
MSEDNNQSLQPSQPDWPDKESMKEIINGLKELGKEYLDNEKQNRLKEHEVEKERVIQEIKLAKMRSKVDWKKFVTLISFLAFCIVAAVVCFLIKDLPPALNSIICFIAGYSAALVLNSNKDIRKPDQTTIES